VRLNFSIEDALIIFDYTT